METREKLQQIKSVLLSKFEDNSLVEELLPFMAVPMEFHVDQFCEERGMEFFQVSSHAGINVATVFHQAKRNFNHISDFYFPLTKLHSKFIIASPFCSILYSFMHSRFLEKEKLSEKSTFKSTKTSIHNKCIKVHSFL